MVRPTGHCHLGQGQAHQSSSWYFSSQNWKKKQLALSEIESPKKQNSGTCVYHVPHHTKRTKLASQVRQTERRHGEKSLSCVQHLLVANF